LLLEKNSKFSTKKNKVLGLGSANLEGFSFRRPNSSRITNVFFYYPTYPIAKFGYRSFYGWLLVWLHHKSEKKTLMVTGS
jgi:hypothetical protein